MNINNSEHIKSGLYKSLAGTMKGKKSLKKYTYENDSLPNHAHITDIREQLRQALEQLEQTKLTV